MKELINQMKPFEAKEQVYLQKLWDHVEALRVLEARAEKSARGKREGGCGCNSCKAQYERAKERRIAAEMKFYKERHRIYGKHSDNEEHALAQYALRRLQERLDE